jgi:hypothetical protein
MLSARATIATAAPASAIPMFTGWVASLVTGLARWSIGGRAGLRAAAIGDGAARGAVRHLVRRTLVVVGPWGFSAGVGGGLRGFRAAELPVDRRRGRRAAVGVTLPRTLRFDDGRDDAWRRHFVVHGRARRGCVGALVVDRLVAIGIRLAVLVGGGTVMLRTLTAAATRGTSTFVHAAVVE